ncbi:MAG: hypothetical protein K2M99_03505, partial [Treponemataceae bacterium]|nr:hypothetical protein [Treponemataceae bacterium]
CKQKKSVVSKINRAFPAQTLPCDWKLRKKAEETMRLPLLLPFLTLQVAQTKLARGCNATLR